MARRWIFRSIDETPARALSAELGISALLGRVMAGRGLVDTASARNFITSSLNQCHPPMLLSGMKAGVARALVALRERQKIVIYGDYDVDGVTSTALLMKLFRLLGATIDYYIPDRITEGYGPNKAAFEKIRLDGASLLITVDCGINAVSETELATSIGLDMIVTDHHVPGRELPAAVAVINPKCSPDYPYDMLAGVAVAYKFAQALLEELGEPRKDEFLDHMLELVALGTVCDVAPLDGENRTLVAEGIKRLKLGRWMGLRSLARAAGIENSAIDSGQIGFALGPRLNAGGRVGDAALGVKLLLSKDPEECRALAEQLNQENRKRQEIEKNVVIKAQDQAAERLAAGDRALVVWSEGWHPGVIGLAASRVQEKYFRPCIAISLSGGIGKGSGRSRRPFHLVKALDGCADLLVKYGGHEFAAGLTISEANLDAFRSRINNAAMDQISDAELDPELSMDCWASLSEINPALMLQMDALQPFGIKNPRPVFAAKACVLLPGTRPVGADASHLKVSLRQGGIVFSGIAFRQAALLNSLDIDKPVDIAFSPDWNEFNGNKTLQLDIKDMVQSS